MAAWQYRASNDKGQVRSGVIEAASAVSARQSLRAQGLLTLEMQESHARVQNADSAATGKKPRRQRGLSLQALTLVTRQLATLLSARLRIDDALSTVAKAQPPHVAGILLTLRSSVVEGAALPTRWIRCRAFSRISTAPRFVRANMRGSWTRS